MVKNIVRVRDRVRYMVRVVVMFFLGVRFFGLGFFV